MASPLQFHGGFQLTENSSVSNPSLKFFNKSANIIIDTAYVQHIDLNYGGHNLAFTLNIPASTYDTTRMFLMF